MLREFVVFLGCMDRDALPTTLIYTEKVTAATLIEGCLFHKLPPIVSCYKDLPLELILSKPEKNSLL